MPSLTFSCEDVHGYTLEILSETGIQIKDAALHERLRHHDVRCDAGSGRIHFERKQVERALQTLPEVVTLAARDPAFDIRLTSDTRLRFMPSGTGVAVFDGKSGRRRSSTLSDAEQFARLCQILPQVDIARPVVTATDRPVQKSDLFEFQAAFRYAAKHVHHRVLRLENVKPLIEMGDVLAGGRASLRRRPLFSVCYCPTSPLSIVPETAACMLAFAEHGIPVLVLSMAMGGATAPATLLGEVMLINTEIIAGVTLIQTLSPGSPVLYGSVSSVMDMKTAILALGAPERGLISGALGRMANYYRIPSVMGGLSSDADRVDFQAGFEKALTAIPLLERVNILFGVGMLHAGNTYSLQQFVLDAEAAGALKALAAEREDDGRETCDLIKKIGACNHYLLEPHTLKHYGRYWRPQFFNRSIDNTLSAPGASLLERTDGFLSETLDANIPKVIDTAADKALAAILKKAVNGPPQSACGGHDAAV